MFFIDLKYYFTCRESNLYKNVAKFQNIFSRIIGEYLKNI